MALVWAIGSRPFAIGQDPSQETFRPKIPKTWVDAEMADLELPLAKPEFSPVHVSADYYYRLKIRPVYRSYPVYMPGREPVGYIESLLDKAPEIIFDASSLKTKDDWIRAGGDGFRRTGLIHSLLARGIGFSLDGYPVDSGNPKM